MRGIAQGCAFSYVSDGSQLKWCTKSRDLGGIIDPNFNFNKHVDIIVHKAHPMW